MREAAQRAFEAFSRPIVASEERQQDLVERLLEDRKAQAKKAWLEARQQRHEWFFGGDHWK